MAGDATTNLQLKGLPRRCASKHRNNRRESAGWYRKIARGSCSLLKRHGPGGAIAPGPEEEPHPSEESHRRPPSRDGAACFPTEPKSPGALTIAGGKQSV